MALDTMSSGDFSEDRSGDLQPSVGAQSKLRLLMSLLNVAVCELAVLRALWKVGD